MNPMLFQYKFLAIRWYGLLMALAFLIGYFLIKKLAKERNINLEAEEYIVYMIFGILAGARLGEIIFYDPLYYLLNPIKIFFTWEGGLASHGGMIGGIFAHWLFCRKYKIKFYDLADIVVIPIALGAMFVRIGNFINGEIVGRITDVSWAMKFSGYDGLRHPSQLYEAGKNFLLFISLWNMRNMKLPRGFLFWLFFCAYSFLRFFVEFFKEYEGMIKIGLTTGQWLSIIVFVVSGIMLIRIWKKWKKTKI